MSTDSITADSGTNYTESERPSLERLCKFKQALNLPWHPEKTVLPGTLFNSSLCHTDDPWSKKSPFTAESLNQNVFTFSDCDGGRAVYKTASSSSGERSAEHLTVSLGVTVGCKFLNASITGSYDKDVKENRDANKTSLHSSVRLGTARLANPPALTDNALIKIKFDGGIEAFEKEYGDYYVAGYVIGGDTGMLLSFSAAVGETLEHLGIEAKAKVLFYETSKKWTKDFRTSSAEATMTINAYDSLTSMRLRSTIDARDGPEVKAVRDQSAAMLDMASDLGLRLEHQAALFGLENGQIFDHEDCAKLTSSGLVAELVLLPVSTLRQVLEWATDDNII